MPSMLSMWQWRRLCSWMPSSAAISSSAASALAAPVTIFLRNSLWPGASMIVYGRLSDSNQICAVSMVIFWLRSACSASIRNAHSKGTPRRSHVALMASYLPSSSESVSWRKRPTSVDLPWSTWPTMTIFERGSLSSAYSVPYN